MRTGDNLGVEYQRCAKHAQEKDAERRASNMRVLTMPDGRSIQYSKAARKKIPAELIEYIRCVHMGVGSGVG